MIIDGHADTLSVISRTGESLESNHEQFDLKRAREAGVGMQVLALFAETAAGWPINEVLKQIVCFRQQADICRDSVFVVERKEDLALLGKGKTGLMLHLEGASAVGSSLFLLDALYYLGVRSVGLTWNHRNLLADGVSEGGTGGGLSSLGRKAVLEINRLGMLLDLAHISPAGFYSALEVSIRPPVVSHANCFALCPHPRNLTDEQLKAVQNARGLVGVTFVPDFVDNRAPNIERLVDHMVHIAEVAGAETLALGSDFDGSDEVILSDVSKYPELINLLPGRGFTVLEIEMITNGNYKRVLNSVL